MNWRRLLRRDWLCQGCDRLGTRRWLADHDCPERDEWERSVREKYAKHPGPWFLVANLDTP